jgi:hypothetical protein
MNRPATLLAALRAKFGPQRLADVLSGLPAEMRAEIERSPPVKRTIRIRRPKRSIKTYV